MSDILVSVNSSAVRHTSDHDCAPYRLLYVPFATSHSFLPIFLTSPVKSYLETTAVLLATPRYPLPLHDAHAARFLQATISLKMLIILILRPPCASNQSPNTSLILYNLSIHFAETSGISPLIMLMNLLGLGLLRRSQMVYGLSRIFLSFMSSF